MDCFVTDIDNTIADTRNRVRRALEEIDRPEVYERTADRYGGFGDHLDGKEQERFWSLFLSGKYLHLDEPAPGSAELLRGINNAGIDLIYRTGRHEGNGDSMRPGTETWLEDHGFPTPEIEGVKLFMKPRRKMNDKEFKLDKLGEEFSGNSGPEEVLGIGDHPDDALVYDRVGMRPILLDWLGLFPKRELENSVPGVTVIGDWREVERELAGSLE